MVVGDPDAGWRYSRRVAGALVGDARVNRALKDYDCGDECLDLTGCPNCEGIRRYKGRAEDILPTLPGNSRVIFVSCVLSVVDDIDLVNKELFRIAGSPDNLFVAYVEPWSVAGWVYPGIRRRILSAPPETPYIRTVTLPWKQETP